MIRNMRFFVFSLLFVINSAFSMQFIANMLGMGQSDPAATERMIRVASESFAQGLSSGIGQSTDQLFTRLNANMTTGGQGDQAMKNFFDSVSGHLARNMGQGGNAHQATSNFFGMFADQFKVGGQGSQAFEQFFASLGRLMQQDGAANNANNDLRDFINRQFQAGGLFEEVKKSMGSFAGRSISEFNQGLREVSDRELRQGSDLREAIQNATRGLRDIAKENMGEGGNIDGAWQEVRNLTDRNVSGFTNIFGKNAIKMSIFSGLGILLTMSGWYGSKFLWKWIEAEFFKPKVLTSYDARGAWSAARDLIVPQKPSTMIFPQELETHANNLITATRSIHKKIHGGAKNVKYRNLLLWGPPGTGKTMFAKRLAQESGLAWAQLSGSALAQLRDGSGITALNDLIKWANKKNGLLIFIDEAESLIASRKTMQPNSPEYQLITHFLHLTGERNDKFMLVMATNHKDVIDSAMHSRIDDLVYVPLPEHEERMQVLGLYRDKILLDATQNSVDFVNSVSAVMTDIKIAEMADKTKGLSNRDLEGIINMIKTDADITDSGLVTAAIVDYAVQQGVNKHAEFLRSLKMNVEVR